MVATRSGKTSAKAPASPGAATAAASPRRGGAAPQAPKKAWGSLVALAIASFTPVLVALSGLKASLARDSLMLSAIVSVLGFFATVYFVPCVARFTLRRGMCGFDLLKVGTPQGAEKVPESLGLACGVVYLVCIILFQQFHFRTDKAFADDWHVEYNAALATICFMMFLGFADDVLDIPWRTKLVMPMVAALPLLMAYGGGTAVVVPKPLREVVGMDILELGILYKAYMGFLIIFCTNSINILAGVNGLEAGQTLIISCAVMVHNALELTGVRGDNPAVASANLFSLFLMMPLATTTLGLLVFNWYPSKVFVGDTFTYFAGMSLAVAGILGHFSEMLLLFFLPQILNFLYSVPQLLKIVPCPRHRLPKFNPEDGLLHSFHQWNAVNAAIDLLGPWGERARKECTEERLTVRLLVFQWMCCAMAFVLRWGLTGVYK